jgi:hypothetical protein
LKCSSTLASPAYVLAEGSDDEHAPSVKSPSTAIAEIERLAIHFAVEPEFRLTIEAPFTDFDYVVSIDANTMYRSMAFGPE